MFEDATATEPKNISEEDKRAVQLAKMVSCLVRGVETGVALKGLGLVRSALSEEASAAGDIHIFDGGDMELKFARYDARIAGEATS